MTGIPVAPKSLESALSYVAAGGQLAIATAYRVTIIEQKHIDRWAKYGKPLLREEGDGYRMQTGNSSIYLFPGQLAMIK
ncbi:hypothetical protein LCGC14_1796210 [marine sediment metagenome]|uniref:Uncharacterized protein n=1 Tax=marine sediment metagenome TaxID=412755 RepID=A0A0F9GR26_9ZZZZ